VIEALRSARLYQLRRWGCRQSDGTMAEVQHSVADYVLFMQDYYHEARHHVSREDGITKSLDSLRKLICLGIACLEQHIRDNNGKESTFDDVIEGICRVGCAVTLQSDFAGRLLQIGHLLTDAEKYEAQRREQATLSRIWALVEAGVRCFVQFGIEHRDLTQVVINGRDHGFA